MVLLAVHIFFPSVQATNQPTLKYNIIILQLSPVCEISNKYNLTSDCPKVKDLVPFDTSNQYVSGKFIDHDGIITRTNPEVKNHWLYYSYITKPVVCVECTYPGGLADAVKTITVDSHEVSWVDTNQNSTNGSPIHSQSIYIPDCFNAEVSLAEINQTINYFKNNCIGTKPSVNSTITINNTPWDYKDPYSSLNLKTYLQSIFNGHYINGNHTSGGLGPNNCINHKCNYIDPYKKAGW